MNIAIDVDEVLRDFVGQLIKQYKEDFPDHEIKPVLSWDMGLSFPLGRALYTYFKKTRPKEIFENAPMMEHAREVLEDLYSDGHIIWLVTSQERGNEAYTCNWLKKNQIPYHHLVFTNDKSKIACDILVDDGLHNLNEFSSTGSIAVAMDRPWNKEWSGDRVHNLKEFYDYIFYLGMETSNGKL